MTNTRKKNFLVNFNNNKKLKNKTIEHFIFFDTETNQREEIKKIGTKEYKTIVNTLQMGWSCYLNMKTGEEDWKFFDIKETFIIHVDDTLKKTNNNSVWIIAHNIVFDAIITDIWTYFKEVGYESEFVHSKGMVFIQKFKNKNGKTVFLVNNGNIFPTKLETIGKTVGLDKMEVNFEKDSYEYIKAYCRRDVEILVVFWKQWVQFIKDNELGKLKYTISSQSMEAFKKRFCKAYVVLDDDLENLAFERLGYYGGRTEIFYQGKVTEKVLYYDVNSMYPYVMSEFRFPTEFKFFKESPSIEYVKQMIEKGWLVMAEVNLNSDERAYPLRQKELVFPIGEFTTYLATPEIEYAFSKNHIVSFGRVSFYHGEYLFKDYVEFFYNKRQELKKQGNKQEGMYKLFLNSLYGKFGQMNDQWESISEDDVMDYYPNFNIDEWVMGLQKLSKIILCGIDVTPRLRFLGNEIQISKEKTESNISFPAIASHVTSYARMTLYKYIKGCWDIGLKVYYCDTDSIFVNGEIPEEFVDKYKLGKIKVEKVFENGVQFNGLKNYAELNADGNIIVENGEQEKIEIDEETFLNESKIIKGDGWTLKGISKGAEMIDKNTFVQQEWSGLAKQTYYQKFGRNSGEFWIIYVTKKLDNKINKGIVSDNGDILPFKF